MSLTPRINDVLGVVKLVFLMTHEITSREKEGGRERRDKIEKRGSAEAESERGNKEKDRDKREQKSRKKREGEKG